MYVCVCECVCNEKNYLLNAKRLDNRVRVIKIENFFLVLEEIFFLFTQPQLALKIFSSGTKIISRLREKAREKGGTKKKKSTAAARARTQHKLSKRSLNATRMRKFSNPFVRHEEKKKFKRREYGIQINLI